MLADLIRQTRVLSSDGDLAVPVSGISADSRDVASGDIFVVRAGQHLDGRAFIGEAVEAGAVAIVSEPPAPPDLTVPTVLVPDARIALAELASALYDHPSRRIGLVGVTGTDGKTTTTHLVAAILNAAGLCAGLISTVAMAVGETTERNRTAHTTPPAPIIQRQLARMRDKGSQVAVLEVSSHALV
ncbi:MAG: Mur ligase family protein, partial [Chloroflexota bacterium]